MASTKFHFFLALLVLLSSTLNLAHPGLGYAWGNHGHQYFGLYPEFYEFSYPQVHDIVMKILEKAISREPRMAASLLRLHFHDCFAQNSGPNKNSLIGFEVIDEIKARMEEEWPHTVSCADILALAARGSTVLSGGPYWQLPLGRRDSRTASLSSSNTNIPPPNSAIQNLITLFKRQGLDKIDLVALSGTWILKTKLPKVAFLQKQSIRYNGLSSDPWRTLRRAHNWDGKMCNLQAKTLHGNNQPDETLERTYYYGLKSICPPSGGHSNISPLDFASPKEFDNTYFKLILWGKGLLTSDEVLLTGNVEKTVELVKSYARNQALFFDQFAKSMVKMGNISPLTGFADEVRKNCHRIN
ncbi:hem peroxidase [Dillenia turbinata]|uniref:Peroxidase n=1 Tax=Dillenia turbinata TaxID=194707 RepID=A0AAN8VRJ0_9MAGN